MAILADLNTTAVTQDNKKSVIFNPWSIMTLFCTTKTLYIDRHLCKKPVILAATEHTE